MVRITIDEELKKQILEAGEQVELCDASGHLVGRLDSSQRIPDEAWEDLEELTDEEIQRRCNEPGPRYTTQEVIEHLRKRM